MDPKDAARWGRKGGQTTAANDTPARRAERMRKARKECPADLRYHLNKMGVPDPDNPTKAELAIAKSKKALWYAEMSAKGVAARRAKRAARAGGAGG